MMSRVVWLAAGAAAGAYATVKARHAAYRLSVPGMVDQAAALGTGWREFAGEMATGMASREAQLKTHLLDPPQATPARRPALESDHPKDHGTS